MERHYPPEIARFFATQSFAVVGVSADRAKYGNKVLRCYQQHSLPVVGVHPTVAEVEGAVCYRSLTSIPGPPRSVSVVTPPAAASAVVADAIAAGVKHMWFQPGAEHGPAIDTARKAGVEVIAGGPCVLVALGFHDV